MAGSTAMAARTPSSAFQSHTARSRPSIAEALPGFHSVGSCSRTPAPETCVGFTTMGAGSDRNVPPITTPAITATPTSPATTRIESRAGTRGRVTARALETFTPHPSCRSRLRAPAPGSEPASARASAAAPRRPAPAWGRSVARASRPASASWRAPSWSWRAAPLPASALALASACGFGFGFGLIGFRSAGTRFAAPSDKSARGPGSSATSGAAHLDDALGRRRTAGERLNSQREAERQCEQDQRAAERHAAAHLTARAVVRRLGLSCSASFAQATRERGLNSRRGSKSDHFVANRT